MRTRQTGSAFVWALVGLGVGFVAGWLLLVPPGTEVLAEGERAVAADAKLVDEIITKGDLTPEQIAMLSALLSEDRSTGSKENTCGWPRTCTPRTAEDLLFEIWSWVEVAPIEFELRLELAKHVIRSLDPDLRNTAKEHVCKLQQPEPCVELPDVVWKKAEEASQVPPDDPAQANELWGQVRDEFKDFPSGRAPQ